MENIIQNNKLIADFMGLPLFKNSKEGKNTPQEMIDNRSEYYNQLYILNQGQPNWCTMYLEELPYSTDWNWLMEVVEKIEDATYIGSRAYINISPFKISVYCSGILAKNLSVLSYERSGQHFSGIHKLETVYECVIEFITWFNQQEK